MMQNISGKNGFYSCIKNTKKWRDIASKLDKLFNLKTKCDLVYKEITKLNQDF